MGSAVLHGPCIFSISTDGGTSSMSDDKAMVIFQPSGRRGEVPKGINIIEASRLLGVDIEALCGEKKVCGKCIVRVEEGHFEKYGITSSPEQREPLAGGGRKVHQHGQPRKRAFAWGAWPRSRTTFWSSCRRNPAPANRWSARPPGISTSTTTRPLGCITCEVDPPTFEEPTGRFRADLPGAGA